VCATDLSVIPMTNCMCGHPLTQHDYNHGCEVFLCCDRVRNNALGRRHQEHDGANHQAKPCPCGKYQEGKQ
jgi:hypothetical protein